MDITVQDLIVPTKLQNDAPGHRTSIQREFVTSDRIYIEDKSEVSAQSPEIADAYYTDYSYYPIEERNNVFVSYSYSFYYNHYDRTRFLRNKTSQYILMKKSNAWEVVTGCSPTSATALCPAMTMDAEKLGNLDYIKKTITPEIYANGKIAYYTLEFGEYPQTKVTDDDKKKELLEFITKNQPTSKNKYYQPTQQKKGEPITKFYDEYTFNGEKFVAINLDDNHKPTEKTEFFIIEPIKWKIINWEELPVFLNPNGTGLATTVNLRSEKMIMPPIQFNQNLDGKYTEMWQNSQIRGYLNGYNTHAQNQLGNGSPKFDAKKRFDYRQHCFADEAFGGWEKELKMEQEEILGPDVEINKTIKRSITKFNDTKIIETNNSDGKKHLNKFNISIDETPMTIDEQIKFYIDNGMQFMLHGKSGIGKSRRIQDIDPDFTSIVLRNGILPEEIIGKDTTAPDGKVTWKAPFWYEQLVSKCQAEPDKTHVLFIDELTNVNEHEQSLVFDIILNNTIKPNLGKLPENCVVVSAGNSKDESNSAYNLTEPLFRRYFAHIYLPLDIPTWLEWGSQNRKKKVAIVDEPATSIKDKYHLSGSADKYELVDDLDEYGEPKKNIHPLVASFVGTYPKTFYSSYDADKEKEHSIDPRGWEQLSDVLYNNNGVIRKELLANKLGMQNAELFIAFAKQNFITLEDVVTGNYDISDIPTKFDAKYALALSLRYATEEELPIVRAFISEYLGAEILATYDFAWVNNNPERVVVLEDVKNSTTLPEKVELPQSNFDMSSKQIKFTDFCGEREPSWNSSKISKKTGLTYINCKTKQELIWLCKFLSDYGKKTSHYKTYNDVLETVDYFSKGKPICISNNGKIFITAEIAKKANQQSTLRTETFTIYDFEDIDFTGFLSNEQIEEIEKHFDHNFEILIQE